jgi:flavin-dependent dehydrogenase
MDRCDVLVVGGGPAGSSCAWRLVRDGFDVVVVDKATFPRDKVCAGWITPAVVSTLDLDLREYARTRTLQAFSGFRTGPLVGDSVLTDFNETISYGIRRCEFDEYLLQRSGARPHTGRPVKTLRREGDWWVVDDTICARVVVGAGGHFCPVARWLNRGARNEPVVVAQEIEVPLDDAQAGACPVHSECPELFFWPDLLGYGWCVRKGRYLNVGAGRLSRSEFPAAVQSFVATLETRGVFAGGSSAPWKGHAYLLNRTSPRRLFADGLLLVGDAAGLALAPSGEGILSAVESGILAAESISQAQQRPSEDRLASYGRRIVARFGRRPATARAASLPPRWLASAASRVLLGSRLLTRRVVLEDWFLHRRRALLT